MEAVRNRLAGFIAGPPEKCACLTDDEVLNAAAWALRHVRHEQWRIGESSCDTSY
jgi:hypothetical protein